jgi:hypothetical protein
MDDTQNITDSTSQSKKNNIFVPLAVVGLIVIVVVAALTFQGQKKDESAKVVVKATQAPKSSEAVSVTVASRESVYKDGEYKAVGNYRSPGGEEQVGVTLDLKGDIIENAEVQTMGDRPNTMKFQGIFKDNFKSFVVGKNIDEVRLDKVSGSSLTPKGFNDALEKIKQEAKV